MYSTISCRQHSCICSNALPLMHLGQNYAKFVFPRNAFACNAAEELLENLTRSNQFLHCGPYESKMTMFLLSIQHFIIFVTMLCSGLTKKKKPKIIYMIWLLKVMFTFVVAEKDFGVCIAIVSDS